MFNKKLSLLNLCLNPTSKIMKPNKITVALLFLIVTTCSTRKIPKNVMPKSTVQVNKAAINITISCYKSHGNAVGVVGHVSEVVIKALSSEQIPVVLLGHSSVTEARVLKTEELAVRYKIKVFVIQVTPQTDFRRLGLDMFLSVWWNQMAAFLIIYDSPQGCKGADILLITAWVLSIINTKLICFDRRLGTRILSYNPYGMPAPKPWRLRDTWSPTLDGITRDDFMTFERPYRNGKGICENLDFDKVKDLNGYPVEIMFIRYSYTPDSWISKSWFNIKQKKGIRYNVNQKSKIVDRKLRSTKNSDDYGGALSALMLTGILAMNGTPFYTHMNYQDSDKYLRSNRDLMHGTAPLTSALRVPATRPFDIFELVVLTHHRGYKTQLQKIFSIVDIYSNIGVGSTFLGLLIYFKFFAQESIMSAILNIVRLICNSGIINVPEDTSRRIFLTGVLVFVVTIQGIYQGNLAALLTSEVPFPNIETRRDLIESNHEMYVQRGYETFFTEPELEKRLIIQEGKHDCTEHVLYNLSTACVRDGHNAMDTPHDVHVSKPFLTTLAVLWHRSNWQLHDRFDDILLKLFEGDLVVSFKYRIGHQTLSTFLMNQELRNAYECRKMNLEDLEFAFILLGIGLTCAFIIFIFEIVINQISARNRIKRTMVVPFSSTVEDMFPAEEKTARSVGRMN